MEVYPDIQNIFDLGQHSPEGFTCGKSNDCLLFYQSEFDEETQFLKLLESIKVDSDLHVQLQYNAEPIPLPLWFIECCNPKLSHLSMLENLQMYILNISPYSLLDKCDCFWEKEYITKSLIDKRLLINEREQ